MKLSNTDIFMEGLQERERGYFMCFVCVCIFPSMAQQQSSPSTESKIVPGINILVLHIHLKYLPQMKSCSYLSMSCCYNSDADGCVHFGHC